MWYYHQPVSKLHLWFHVNAVCFVRSDAHLASHSRMSGSRWLITPSWLSGSLRSFLYGCVYSWHLFFIFSVSVRSIEFLSFRSIEFLSFIVPIFAWNVPLVSQVFLKRSLVFPILFSSVQSLGHVRLFATPWTASLCIINSWELASYPYSQWCHSTISSSIVTFSSCLQSFPASGSFQMSWFFASGAQSIGFSASASVLPMNIQDWFPLGCTRWISLQSKGLSRVFSNTTVQKHRFFGPQLSLESNSHIHTWLLKKP